MDSTTSVVIPTVPAEEVERRIEEYRREGFKRRAMQYAYII